MWILKTEGEREPGTELNPPVAFPAMNGQEFNWERPQVDAVLYQTLPLIQVYVRIWADEFWRKGEGEHGNKASLFVSRVENIRRPGYIVQGYAMPCNYIIVLDCCVLRSFLKALQALKEDNWWGKMASWEDITGLSWLIVTDSLLLINLCFRSLPVLKVATLDLRQFAISVGLLSPLKVALSQSHSQVICCCLESEFLSTHN